MIMMVVVGVLVTAETAIFAVATNAARIAVAKVVGLQLVQWVTVFVAVAAVLYAIYLNNI